MMVQIDHAYLPMKTTNKNNDQHEQLQTNTNKRLVNNKTKMLMMNRKN